MYPYTFSNGCTTNPPLILANSNSHENSLCTSSNLVGNKL